MMRKLLELLGTPLNSSFLNMGKTFLDKVVGTLLLSPSTRFQKQTLMCCLLTCEVHLQPLYLLVVCFVLVKAAIRCTTVLVQCKPYPGQFWNTITISEDVLVLGNSIHLVSIHRKKPLNTYSNKHEKTILATHFLYFFCQIFIKFLDKTS